MATKLAMKTQHNQRLPLIHSSDDAINWEASCTPDEYAASGNDATKLVFIEGKEPTVFWFTHPMRMDSKRIVVDIFSEDGGKLKFGSASERIWHSLFEGISEGLQLDPVKKHVDKNFLQSLHDSDVFQELVSAYFLRSNTDDAKKKS